MILCGNRQPPAPKGQTGIVVFVTFATSYRPTDGLYGRLKLLPAERYPMRRIRLVLIHRPGRKLDRIFLGRPREIGDIILACSYLYLAILGHALAILVKGCRSHQY